MIKKSTVRAALAGVAAGGIMAGAAIAGTGYASALSIDGYASVRQVLCSEAGATVNADYVNGTGNYTSREGVRLLGQGDDANKITCAYADVSTDEYGGYISTSISDESGGYVYCAIYVGGVKYRESEDNSSYYSLASCY